MHVCMCAPAPVPAPAPAPAHVHMCVCPCVCASPAWSRSPIYVRPCECMRLHARVRACARVCVYRLERVAVYRPVCAVWATLALPPCMCVRVRVSPGASRLYVCRYIRGACMCAWSQSPIRVPIYKACVCTAWGQSPLHTVQTAGCPGVLAEATGSRAGRLCIACVHVCRLEPVAALLYT